MKIKACAVKQKALFGTEWILRLNFEETMPDTVKPLATTLPSPPAFSSDGIFQQSLSPGEYQTQRHYLESGQGVQGVLLQKQGPCKLNIGGESNERPVPVSAAGWRSLPDTHPQSTAWINTLRLNKANDSKMVCLSLKRL